MKECVSQPNWLLMVFFHYQICAYNSCYMNWFPGFSPSTVHQPTHTPAARHYRPTRFCYLGPKGISMMSHGLVRRSFLALAEGFFNFWSCPEFPWSGCSCTIIHPSKTNDVEPEHSDISHAQLVCKGGKIKLIHWGGVLMATRFPSWNSLVPSETAR